MSRRCRCDFGDLTPEQAADVRRRADASIAWLRTNRYKRGWISYDPSDPEIPDFVRNEPSNAEKGELELFEFMRDRPDRYFAYYDGNALTTWTSNKLADIIWRGATYRSNMGDTRFNIRARAVTGDEYAGTCTASAGTYCRIRKIRRTR